MLRAATLSRHRLEIHRTAEIPAVSGGTKSQERLVDERFASIEQVSARETVRADQVQVRATHLIRMRWQGGRVHEKDVLVERDRGGAITRRFHVESVLNVGERDVELEILATEKR